MSDAEKYTFTNRLPENIPVPNTELALRLFEPADAGTLLEIATEEKTAKYVPWAKAVKDEETSRQMIGRFHNQWQQGMFARYLVMRHDETCGYFGIWPADVPDMYEIGIAVLPQYRSRGLLTRFWMQQPIPSLSDRTNLYNIGLFIMGIHTCIYFTLMQDIHHKEHGHIEFP